MRGIFSEKSDVFSFGVIVLEIVSGKKNSRFYKLNCENDLLSYVSMRTNYVDLLSRVIKHLKRFLLNKQAWSHWKEGRALEIVDPVIVDSLPSLPLTSQPQEVLKCIQIGLLCVQERAEHRPTMASVVWMLGSEATDIPQPKPPGYCIQRSPYELDPSSSRQCNEDESWTVNQYTCSLIDAR